MGENLKLVDGLVFNIKLGCFDDVHVLIYADAHPHLYCIEGTEMRQLGFTVRRLLFLNRY